jgi:predicted hydrocarbon binding protein
VNINDQFPSKYLKASDLKGKKIKVTISEVGKEEVGDGNKPVLYFVGKDKGMVLNKTNAMTIASSYGPDTDKWEGKELCLYSAKVNFQNQMVDSLRVEVPVEMAEGEPNF